MRITLKQLDVFVSIAREGSVTRAAGHLSLTQSATSMALSDLEHQLGIKLFDRIGRRLQLNAVGEQLLPLAQETVARAQEIEALALDEHPGSGRLRVAASLSIGNTLMPALMGRFLADHPAVELSLDVGNTRHVIEAVRSYGCDIGFIEGSCQDPDIAVSHWRDDELVVFASSRHPLAQATQVTVQDLQTADWILRESGSGTREVFDRAIQGQLQQLRVRLELSHTEAVLKAVEAGIGLGCASQLTLTDSLQQGRVVILPTPWLDLKRSFFILQHRDKYASHTLRAFRRLAESTTDGP